MAGIRRVALIAAGLSGLVIAWQAMAQSVGNDKVTFQSALIAKKPKSGLPDVPAPPQAWPRLDAGAILCSTEDDLDRLAARQAGQAVGGPVDCQMMQNMTAVTILQRKGPGKEEVKLTSGKVGTTGWTNAWLPDKSPAPTRTAATAR